MKFGQLKEYNMRKIFLEKSYTTCCRDTIPRSFSKNFLDQYSKVFIYFVLIVCQDEDYQKSLKLSYRLFAFTSNKSFLKNKRKSGTSLPALFSAWFLKKIFMLLYSIIWPNFNVWLPLLREIRQYVYYNCLLTRLRRQKF